ncbi:ketopantoate reductase family protein [Lacticaseibacillus sharpeae]|uniref:2-dehydropantoate 2-reductase n=1 Tax=Lacticaseibacillus sharpeae JCM 1186 = DSM 20505 TaxID=1291052 RepID=A0A0R1ZPH1_9LACO|nr:ketopantoate reductase family protein [Lacticaseibacillus sharpeae]KRM56274.1 2-dehydropantoate 2-reductase [Lacticaseibacillus sharpeae JCM 1186 = DSM 20505]
MHYTVLGAGAMGLRYGVLLQEHAGATVDFVDTWQPQVDTCRAQGGVYVSRDGQNKHLVPINIFTPEEYTGTPDAYIIFCKQMGLAEMLERSAHFFKPNQYAITCMNGMGHIEKINQYFPAEHVLGGTALVATVLNGAGDVDFIGQPGAGTMNICPETEKPDAMTPKFLADLTAAHLNPNLTDNFLGTLMAKVTFNSVVNTLCTMYQIRMGEFIAAPTAEKLSKQLIEEAYSACEAAGIQLLNSREEEWESIVHVSAVANPLHFPSMYQDFSKNRPTEVDYINGFIYDLGHKHGYEAKTHDFLRNLVHLAEFSKTFDVAAFTDEVHARAAK